jgi:DNA-binding response OmpR family regulator
MDPRRSSYRDVLQPSDRQARVVERFRFADFEFDCHSGELRRDGTSLKLQPQPAKVLAILIQRAGEIVSRQELAAEVWKSDTFVDFEQGLNYGSAILRHPDRPIRGCGDHERGLIFG